MPQPPQRSDPASRADPPAVRVGRIRVNRILVPTDFSVLSLDALHYASRLAGIVKADLLLLHVTESRPDAERAGRLTGELEGQIRALRATEGLDPTMQVHTRLETGRIGERVADVALREDVDLVVRGTRGSGGRSAIKRFFIDSNARRTVELSRVPVLTLREIPKPFRLRDILLPLDLTQQTHRKVHFAINLAKLFDARLHLVAVAHLLETLRGQDDRLERYMHTQEAYIRAAGIEVSTEIIRHDNVGDSVVTYAEEIDADLIVIVTGRENRLDTLLMGSRAGRVIDHAHRPVLSLHPRDLDALMAR
jgi:nucleotide-binding universal stress UspA family protein